MCQTFTGADTFMQIIFPFACGLKAFPSWTRELRKIGSVKLCVTYNELIS